MFQLLQKSVHLFSDGFFSFFCILLEMFIVDSQWLGHGIFGEKLFVIGAVQCWSFVVQIQTLNCNKDAKYEIGK